MSVVLRTHALVGVTVIEESEALAAVPPVALPVGTLVDVVWQKEPEADSRVAGPVLGARALLRVPVPEKREALAAVAPVGLALASSSRLGCASSRLSAPA